jgi:histone-arginine methyltransferase CARM1
MTPVTLIRDPPSNLVYFQYYSSLQSQANMLGDTARTEAYRRAILGNAKVAFKGKRVMDLGAGESRSCNLSGPIRANAT